MKNASGTGHRCRLVNLVLYKRLAWHGQDRNSSIEENGCDRQANFSWLRRERARTGRAKDSDHCFTPFLGIPALMHMNEIFRELQFGILVCVVMNFPCDCHSLFAQHAPSPIAHSNRILFERGNCVVRIYVARCALQEETRKKQRGLPVNASSTVRVITAGKSA